MTHFDFGGCEASTAVHSLQGDGVELSLVQVHHGQLVGFVTGSRGSSQGKLELVSESLGRRGAGVGAGVDGAGGVLGEGVAVGKSLGKHARMCISKGKHGRGQKSANFLTMTQCSPRCCGRGKLRSRATSAAGSRR